MELSERKEKILAAVVEQYIKTGEPVGSKALLDSLDMSVSSATVRNEMADLGYLGLLDQPHTSAGRVPPARAIDIMLITSSPRASSARNRAGLSTRVSAMRTATPKAF